MSVLVVQACFASLALAQLPRHLNYQGKLAGADGAALPDGPRQLTFSLWDAAESGNRSWREVHPAVPVRNGVFSVRLGESLEIPAAALEGASFLQVQVGAEPALERQELTAAPYALAANVVEAGGVSEAALIDASVETRHVAPGSVTGAHVEDASLTPFDRSTWTSQLLLRCPPLAADPMTDGWRQACKGTVPASVPENTPALIVVNGSLIQGCDSTNPTPRVMTKVELRHWPVGRGLKNLRAEDAAQTWSGAKATSGLVQRARASVSITELIEVDPGDVLDLRRHVSANGACGPGELLQEESYEAWVLFMGVE